VVGLAVGCACSNIDCCGPNAVGIVAEMLPNGVLFWFTTLDSIGSVSSDDKASLLLAV
jgi:hypothetical protein